MKRKTYLIIIKKIKYEEDATQNALSNEKKCFKTWIFFNYINNNIGLYFKIRIQYYKVDFKSNSTL